MKVKDVNKQSCSSVKEYLAELIEKLDDLDESDYFGTEGWRRMLMGEDD